MSESERRDIAGFEGMYQVAADGTVYSLKRDPAGKAMKPGKNAGGYLHLRLLRERSCKVNVDVHVAVAAAFLGPRPAGMQVNHKDGVKTNNCAANLEYCTRSENLKHAHAIGLACHWGERNPRCKIKTADLAAVRTLIAAGVKRAEIAQAYRVTPTRISQIKRGDRIMEVAQ